MPVELDDLEAIGAGPPCPNCGDSTDWLPCPYCDEYGNSHHDCGEDCCCCLYPENNVVCDMCNGAGGWWRCWDCKECFDNLSFEDTES